MTDFRENKQCCHFHPKQLVVGICARCLRDRLLLLESKQAHLPRTKDGIRSFRVSKRKSIIALPKVFALGSFIHLLEPHHRENKDRSEDEASIDSLEGKRLVQIRWVDHVLSESIIYTSIDLQPRCAKHEQKNAFYEINLKNSLFSAVMEVMLE
ncbi:hypothetical protein MUK42_16226 [Musa troglodytarum]|uniref:Uncharacterized protein n=1 Tax=Musa troglodytarum TaxID=320322 RepID=A0A9E7HEY4_9LILI|nr:hypothetical protein MUK42_16226 [Musa troglodytarum]